MTETLTVLYRSDSGAENGARQKEEQGWRVRHHTAIPAGPGFTHILVTFERAKRWIPDRKRNRNSNVIQKGLD